MARTLPPIISERPLPVGHRPKCLYCGRELRPHFRYIYQDRNTLKPTAPPVYRVWYGRRGPVPLATLRDFLGCGSSSDAQRWKNPCFASNAKRWKGTSTMTTWPKFLLRAWPNELRRVISREEAKKLGFDDRSLDWLEQRQVLGTENDRRDTLSLYTQEDAARDAAPELLAMLKEIHVRELGREPFKDASGWCCEMGRLIAKAEGQE